MACEFNRKKNAYQSLSPNQNFCNPKSSNQNHIW